MTDLEAAYGYHSVGDLIWWPLFAMCVLGVLDRWIDADKETLPQVQRIGYLTFAVATPAVAVYFLFLAGQKYGWSHAGIALAALLIGPTVIKLPITIVATLVMSVLGISKESKIQAIRWFKKFPSQSLSAVLLPVVIYALLMMYYRKS